MLRLIAIAFLAVSLCAPAQAQEPAEKLSQAIKSLSHGAADRGIQQYQMPDFHVALTDDKEVNAYADVSTHWIHITRALVSIMSVGEVAFVIAHEIGHIQDASCHARGAAQHLSGLALLRMCETAADQIGMQYILAAGYSPFEAAGVMGKLLMVHPDQGSVLGIVFNRFLSDHPVDVDRIRQLVVYAQVACKDRPEMCTMQ